MKTALFALPISTLQSLPDFKTTLQRSPGPVFMPGIGGRRPGLIKDLPHRQTFHFSRCERKSKFQGGLIVPRMCLTFQGSNIDTPRFEGPVIGLPGTRSLKHLLPMSTGSFVNHWLRSKSAYMQSFAASFETLLRGGTFDPSICTQHFGAFGAFGAFVKPAKTLRHSVWLILRPLSNLGKRTQKICKSFLHRQ